MSKKDYIVFSLGLVEKLIESGFKPVNQRRDYKDINRFVYFFENTPELRAAIEKAKQR